MWLSGLELWAGEPSVRSEPLASLGKPLQSRYPSRFSTTTHSCGTRLLCISASPTSVEVASSARPQLHDFCSARPQLTPSDTCSVV